jgi:putative flavoprotein involved in K+ transport
MSSYQAPRIPAFARELDPSIVQLHTLDYRRPSQVPDGDVLVVGAGNSGAEIAMDLLAAGRRVHLSGRIPGQVPFDVRKRWVRRTIMRVLFRGIFHRVLTVDTPIGRRARPKFLTGGTPLIRTRSQDLDAAGVARVGRTTGARDGRPLLADGRVLDVRGIVWCTGFALGGGWVDLPVFDDHGEPVTEKGIVPNEPGLYFVGTHFVYAVSSAMVHGVERDAARITSAIAARLGRPALAA